MNFTKKDGIFLLIYVALVAAQFFVIDKLGFSDTATQTLHLCIVLLNAFIVIYTYRRVLGGDWHEFMARPWTKWLVILGSFAVIYGLMTLIRQAGAKSGGETAEAAALEAVSVAADNGIAGLTRMPAYTFIITLVASLIPLLSAVTEEVVFRYVLMFKHSLKGRALQYVMLTVSSILFGILHYQMLGSVSATIPYIFVAMLFSVLYLWQKNIWYSIFTHLFFNGVNVVLALFVLIIQQIKGA